jgi:hypothetical protein
MLSMKQIIIKLIELSEQIGNGAAVSVSFRPRPPIPPEVLIRVDWPNKFHVEHAVHYDDVMNEQDADQVLGSIVYHVKQEYQENNKPNL